MVKERVGNEGCWKHFCSSEKERPTKPFWTWIKSTWNSCWSWSLIKQLFYSGSALKMIITNSVLPRWLSITSYPAPPRRIIVKYHSMYLSLVLIGLEPTTWPANNCFVANNILLMRNWNHAIALCKNSFGKWSARHWQITIIRSTSLNNFKICTSFIVWSALLFLRHIWNN